MKVVLRGYDIESCCGVCGYSSASVVAHIVPCSSCGAEAYRKSCHIVRVVLVGRWFAPWTWRIIKEAPK